MSAASSGSPVSLEQKSRRSPPRRPTYSSNSATPEVKPSRAYRGRGSAEGRPADVLQQPVEEWAALSPGVDDPVTRLRGGQPAFDRPLTPDIEGLLAQQPDP